MKNQACSLPKKQTGYPKIPLLTLAILFSYLSLSAQFPFQARYVGTGDEYGTAIVKSFSGGYLIGGSTERDPLQNDDQAKLLSIDRWGDTLWTKTFQIGQSCSISDIIQLPDTTYLVLGWSGTSFLMKINDSGQILWTKGIQSTGSYLGATNLSLTPNGDIMLLGGSYLIKMNMNGDTLWTRGYNSNNGSLTLEKVLATNDGNNILIGGDFGPIGLLLILKVDSNGDTLWTKSYLGNGFFGDFLHDVEEIPSVGYAISGQTGLGPSENGLILLIDTAGTLIWSRKFSSNQTGGYYGQSILVTDNNEIIFGGTGNYKLFTAKLNLNGDTLWTALIDNYSSTSDYIGINGYDDELVFCGTSLINNSYEMYLATISNDGEIACGKGHSQITVLSSDSLFELALDITVTSGIPGFTISNLNYSIVPDSTSIELLCVEYQQICVVTVDPATNKNTIVWERLYDSSLVDHYNIYRETTVGDVYEVLGTVDINDIGLFTDATSNPNQRSSRYRITQVLQNGYETPPSATHKTIHLTINQGIGKEINLIWDDYEGTNFGTYKIWRGNTSAVQLIDSVANSITSYTDQNPPVGDSIYFIEVVLPDACDPTLKTNSFSSSISNKVSLNLYPTGIKETANSEIVSLYPNPTNERINIKGKGTINIYNSIGKKIYAGNSNGLVSVNMETWRRGLYLVEIENSLRAHYLKFIKK